MHPYADAGAAELDRESHFATSMRPLMSFVLTSSARRPSTPVDSWGDKFVRVRSTAIVLIGRKLEAAIAGQ
jgi:hypothetical protein